MFPQSNPRFKSASGFYQGFLRKKFHKVVVKIGQSIWKNTLILCKTVTTMFVQMFYIMWEVFSHGPFQLSAMNYWHSWGWKIWQIPAAFVGYKTARKWHDSSLGGQLLLKRVGKLEWKFHSTIKMVFRQKCVLSK